MSPLTKPTGHRRAADGDTSAPPAAASPDVVLARLDAVGLHAKDNDADVYDSQNQRRRRASILVGLVFENSQYHVLLTQRPPHMRSHAGEVCCPGGKQDAQDEQDDVRTALREAQEEVGLVTAHVHVVCRLPTIVSVGGLCVTPIVATVDRFDYASLMLNAAEVDAAFLVPLHYFQHEYNHVEQRVVEWQGRDFVMRTFHVQDTARHGADRTFVVWGLTAHVCHQLSVLAYGSETLTEPVTAPPPDRRPMSGALHRWQASSSPRRTVVGHWVQYYYVLDGNGARMLHQYDTAVQARRKQHMATKKNRILLHDAHVCKDDGNNESSRYVFTVAAPPGGAVVWKLAAATDTERQVWMTALLGNTATQST